MLYEGRQIYFGKATEAKAYFENLGFTCPEQQTTADFLTSMTSHQERIVRPDFEGKAPRTPDEFAQAWKNSKVRAQLDQSITHFIEKHPFHDKHYDEFFASRRQDQSKNQRTLSPFTLSYWGQVKLTLWRSWLLFVGDPSTTVTMFVMNFLQALIVSSIFYNLQPDSSTIAKRGILIFFLVLMNAFSSILEIMTLYARRRVVEKHARYALYHPSAEALAAMVCDLPYKVVNCILTNLILYFMTNLRREPGPFFFFLLNIFVITLTMSMMFRLMGSLTKTIAQALAPASVILLVIMLYTGYAIKVQNMQNWLAWLRFLNPVYYGFESLMLNEFIGRTFDCAMFIPSGDSYGSVFPLQRICSIAGSQPGEAFVDGTTYLDISYGYINSHRWRNFGIMLTYMVFFLVCHLVATEYVASERSKGEVLVFTREAMSQRKKAGADVEATPSRTVVAQQGNNGPANITSQTSIFHWSDVCYDVKVGNETRRILDHVDGWVMPGTLTALMVCHFGTIRVNKLTFPREYLVRAKQLSSMPLQAESQWVLSLGRCSWTAILEISHSSAKRATSRNKIFTCTPQLLGKLSHLALYFASLLNTVMPKRSPMLMLSLTFSRCMNTRMLSLVLWAKASMLNNGKD